MLNKCQFVYFENIFTVCIRLVWHFLWCWTNYNFMEILHINIYRQTLYTLYSVCFFFWLNKTIFRGFKVIMTKFVHVLGTFYI